MPIAKRQDAYSPNDQQQIYYTDFQANFDLNPITGLLTTLDNEDAVKQSLAFLVLTDIGERPLDSINIGSRISNGVFEPDDQVQLDFLRTTLLETIAQNEPRAQILSLTVDSIETLASVGEMQLQITIVFRVINIPNTQTTLTLLKRVR